MAKKNTYLATIQYEGGADMLDVDMLALPYDMFGPKFPLEIQGNVDMGKCKKQVLPDMSNVIIYGEFDCSDCVITKDSVLPDGITTLICKHSIGGLDVLFGKLPKTLEVIVVRGAILTAIKDSKKKNSQDATAYENALRFIEMYPNIVVTDGKKTLKETVEACTEKVVEKPVVKVQQEIIKPTLEQQTDDWLSVNDLISVCEVELGPDVLENLDKDLKRYIRQALNNKGNIKIESHEMRRADGSTVKCIRKEDVHLVIEYIKQSMAEKTEKKAERTSKSTKKSSQTTPFQPEVKKYYIDSREIHPIKIKKYISKAAWGQILSKVGKNTTALREILQDIENINVNPALAHTASGQVVFIKDNQVQVSPTVGFKNGRCLAQGFGTLDDRPRIVWGICGNTFVCQNFYSAHEGKVKLEYNKLLREIDIDISKLDLSEYLLVSDLIKELSVERPVDSTVKETQEIKEEKKEKTTELAPVIKPDAKADTVVAENAPEPKQKEPVTIQPTIKTEVNMPNKPDFKSSSHRMRTNIPQTAPKTPYWASLYHLSAQIKADYRATVMQQQKLLNAMSQPMATEQMLDCTNELHELLCHKKDLEIAMQQVEEKNKELFAFINQIKNEIKR